ncbi:MAG: ATP phosphoribosyltransferase regulatory subunit, partial [Sandaracinaceae bacterium]|nr:ATP phosphoribosyltransferase regulatory subunit [Sandaracinaceae bacterium]
MREPIAVPLAPPTGMRDLLPPDAAARGALAGTLTATFASYGYQLVTTPPFEHAEVIERGLDTIDRRDLLRFVEPESGEVALLRPDITPQIARIVATRLADRPPPFRLCYAGSLIRQRRGRARTQRQIMQAGVEHLGPSSAPGQADAEVIAIAVEAARRTGLTALHLELHLVGLARAAIHELPEASRDAASAALSRKDRVELEAIVRRAGADRAAGRRLARASELYGELSLLEEARRVFPGREARAALDELEAVASKLAGMGVAGGGLELSVDLGEVRGT